MNFGEYSVKNVVSFVGMDGYGFNANLYRGKKKVAFCVDDGNGGEVNIHWEDGYNGEESKLLTEFVKTIPPVPCDIEGVESIAVDVSFFVSCLIDVYENQKLIKKLKKQCETKTLFRIPNQRSGEYFVKTLQYSPNIAQIIRSRYPDAEIFNEVFANNKTPSIFP